MNALNKGKWLVGGTTSVSFGNGSPADDATPLAWKVGDVRYFTGGDATQFRFLKWVCIVAGTPGTWQLVSVPAALNILQVPFTFNGPATSGTEQYMAPATADWKVSDEAFPLSNIIPVPYLPDLADLGPTFVQLDVWFAKNDWDTPTVSGITFRIYKQDGTTILASGTVNAGDTGKFLPCSVALAPGVIDSTSGLICSMEVDGAAGTGLIGLNAVLTLYRDKTLPF